MISASASGDKQNPGAEPLTDFKFFVILQKKSLREQMPNTVQVSIFPHEKHFYSIPHATENTGRLNIF
jgi:hypothetical protein